MATKYWLGTAPAVSQIVAGAIGVNDAASTYKITIGGVVISVIGQANANATAAALVAAANASTHPYFAAITWSVPSGSNVRGTADIAGVPFVATLTVTGGTGTVTAFSTSTAASGPNDWSVAANWSDGVVPVNGDNVIIADSSVNISWGLDQNAVDLNNLTIERTFTGKIGLNRKVFATDSSGDVGSAAALEYRQDYLKIGYTTAEIGINNGPTTPAGSGRIKIDNDNTANPSDTIIYGTAQNASESGLQCIRLKFNNATNCNLYVRSAPGGVGVATDKPGETSTLSKISISDESSSSRVFVGEGTTLTEWEQYGGNNVVQLAATLPTLTMYGGILQTEGNYTVTQADIHGGTWLCNHIKTGGDAITTLNLMGGLVDTRQSTDPRTFDVVNFEPGSTLRADGTVLTITTLNDYAGPYSLSMG